MAALKELPEAAEILEGTLVSPIDHLRTLDNANIEAQRRHHMKLSMAVPLDHLNLEVSRQDHKQVSCSQDVQRIKKVTTTVRTGAWHQQNVGNF